MKGRARGRELALEAAVAVAPVMTRVTTQRRPEANLEVLGQVSDQLKDR